MGRLILRSLALLLLGLVVTRASAQQHMVLFETFTNSYDQCPGGNSFDADFKQTLSSYGSKVIHLNHHIVNVGDPMAQFGGTRGSGAVNQALTGAQVGEYFVSAVDRTTFSDFPRATRNQSDWESRVSSEASKSPSATISLVDVKFDKVTYTLHALVQVTALKAISGATSIHYAITEDNITYAQCGGSGPSLHNNVVRYITVRDSALFPASVQAGQTATVEYTQKIASDDPRLHINNMRLVAFITNSSTVLDAAVLKKNFDTLQAPPQVLEFVDTSIDNKVYHPGDVAVIDYNSLNVQYADAFYSLDNGTTWHGFATSVESPVTWTVPDSATTQGKFKLVGPDGILEAMQKGTFSIVANAHSLTLLHPTNNDTARMLLKFLIQWRKAGFNAVKLEYTLDGGANWTTISESVTDTFYNWTVPNFKTNQAQIRITALGVSDVPSITSPQFTITGGAGVRTDELYPLQILSTYPNPVTNDRSITLGVKAPASSLNLQVLDLLGNEVYRSNGYAAADGTLHVSTKGLSAGTYIVRITDGISTDSKRIVVE